MKKTNSIVTQALKAIVLALPFLLLGGGWGEVFAQSITPEVISSGEGDTSTANVSLSWTVGEPVSETVTGTNAMITQGFHQSHYEIISVEEYKNLGYDIVVYPNPTTDFITVEIKSESASAGNTRIKFELIDLSSKLLFVDDKVELKDQYFLDMSGFSAGGYMLRVSKINGELIHSFRIQKLN